MADPTRCCTGNCRQGRDCPERHVYIAEMRARQAEEAFIFTVIIVVLLGAIAALFTFGGLPA